MGLLSDFYVARRENAKEVLAGNANKQWPRVELKGLDPVKLASLQRALAEHLGREPGETTAKLLTDQDAEQWVLLVPEPLVEMLAEGERAHDAVAKAWVASGALELEGWTVATAKRTLATLARVAGKARASHTDLLLRLSM
jgi:hypothetical protein